MAGLNSRNSAKTQMRPILVVAATAVIFGLPMLLFGPLLESDTRQHLDLIKHFTHQFWGGDPYPRWLRDMNHGLGSPSYFVFAPFPAFVSTMLDPVGRALHLSAFNLASFLALLTSGISAFMLLRNGSDAKGAVLGAALYMAMPYRLMIDMYIRCAVSESWALAWMPLVLYFLRGTTVGNFRAVVGFAFSFALLIFSHFVSAAMFSPILLALAFTLSPAGVRIRTLIRVASGIALGVGLSAVYLFPAFANGKYISAPKFVSLWTRAGGEIAVLSFGLDRQKFYQLISWADLGAMILGTICAFAVWRKASGDSSGQFKRLTIFWTTVCGIAVFMMSRLSLPIWWNLHPLERFIQHPWRFSAILCIGVLSLVDLLFSQRPWPLLARDNRLRAALCVIAVLWILSYASVWQRYRVQSARRQNLATVRDMSYWSLDADSSVNLSAALLASGGPQARFGQGTGAANVTVWKPRHIEFETNASTNASVVINQFYYPAWTAMAKDFSAPLQIQTALPEGLLKVQVPAGFHHIRLEIPVSPSERVGRWVTGSCLLICLGMVLRKSLP